MYREITLKEFIKSNNPYAIFYEYNEIKIKDQEFYDKFKGVVRLPEDFEEMIKDLKLLGKKQVR